MSAPLSRTDTGYFRQILQILVTIGVAIRRTLAQTAADAGSLPGADAACARVSRTIRRIILLAMQIGAPEPGAPTRPRACLDHDRPEAGDGSESVERGEALDPCEAGYRLTNKTMDEIIGEICLDLGLPPLDTKYDWLSLTPAAIAKLVVTAAESLMSAAASAGAPGRRRGDAWPSPAGLAQRGKASPHARPEIRDG